MELCHPLRRAINKELFIITRSVVNPPLKLGPGKIGRHDIISCIYIFSSYFRNGDSKTIDTQHKKRTLLFDELAGIAMR